MSDFFQFDFDSTVWKNQRSLIRKKGTESFWYKVLNALLKILADRASRLSWLYRQMWLETADTTGLVLWGVRFKIEKLPGETDDSYRTRLLLAKLFKLSIPTVATKRQVIQYATSLAADQISYLQLYTSEEGKSGFKMGSEVDREMLPRKYILHRYRFLFPKLSDLFDRNGLSKAMDAVNVGGNVPELWEDQGEFDPFVMGGTLTGKFQSRRSEKVREFAIY
ncbi:hypothetical protein CH379_019210 [Leptospira ellisii]|uniref:Uncharacterized protein n=1 Tax=Leptospira ellisii TaxID=2023197 RepID=A0A2N0BBZ5_9LEPT|nr:hypothetical protein [Leptospira ellisii]MDV6237763.1 hypothetical protein [Leptospira ellisii]PJZ94033.1 hypothetical protein CH379_04860 [Leptospira ellisii]PKA04245.1 hypothetical protein CH375_12130 [Leptospira ellisii]